MISDACQTLKRNREQYLRGRSTANLIRLLSETASSWLESDNRFRALALQKAAKTGFAVQTLAAGLDAFFSQVTEENLQALLTQELGHSQRLDRPVATRLEQQSQRAAQAIGPELIVHINPGNLPIPALMNIILGILVRSAQFAKCASGAALIPRLFAHSIYEADPKLASCLEIAEWRGGNLELESALFQEADCVTVTGSDETLRSIRQRLPIHARFLGYGHRVSFGYISREVLSLFNANRLAAQAARDVIAWNQLGCLSPHVLYVEHGGSISAEQFAEMLACELARREDLEPRGEVSPETAAQIASRRAFYEIRAAHSPDTRNWWSPGSTAWTVVYEADPRFQISCLHRFIYVKGVAHLTEALQAADPFRGRVSTVGLAAPEEKSADLVSELARWGVTRVCTLGQMQNPPLTWRHDGRPALGDLISWTDWEQPPES